MKILKKVLALMLAVCLATSLVACTSNSNDSDIEQAIEKAGKYLVKKNTKPSYGDEMMMVGLIRSGYIDYWHNRAVVYESSLNNFLNRNSSVVGEKGEVYSDGYPPVILAFTATGKYADRTASSDLLMGISFENIVMDGGPQNKINALIALQSAKYELYAEGDLSRQDYIDYVLSLQQDDGSFYYDNAEKSKIYITSTAVTALSLCDKTNDITSAINTGVDYIVDNINTADTLEDKVYAVIALNSAGIDARDVSGKDLLKEILVFQKDDGAFSVIESDKKGNQDDTVISLLALASQYRFENGQTSMFDMTDIAGGTHNKLSPEWNSYLNIMKIFAVGMLVFMVILLIISRIRIKKWRQQGIYNEDAGRMMTDAEIEVSRRRLEQENTEDNN